MALMVYAPRPTRKNRGWTKGAYTQKRPAGCGAFLFGKELLVLYFRLEMLEIASG